MSVIQQILLSSVPATGSNFITWQGKVGVTETANSTITCTASSWGNSGCYSLEQAASGNIKVECEMPNALEQGIIGISNATDAAANRNYTNIDYSLFLFSGGIYAVESGSVIGLAGSYTTGDKFTVEVTAGQVIYRKNGGSPLRTVASPTLNYPLCVDVAFELIGGQLKNCKIFF